MNEITPNNGAKAENYRGCRLMKKMCSEGFWIEIVGEKELPKYDANEELAIKRAKKRVDRKLSRKKQIDLSVSVQLR